MKKIFSTLNSPRVILGSGFMIGFVYELKLNEKTLEYPLTTICNATLGGFITYLGTELMYEFIPPNLRFVIPVAACASCIYYKYRDIYQLSTNNLTSNNVLNKN